MTVDVDKSEKLIRLLDTVVIKLEGGTEEDLKALDEPLVEDKISNEKPGKLTHFTNDSFTVQYQIRCLLFRTGCKNPSEIKITEITNWNKVEIGKFPTIT